MSNKERCHWHKCKFFESLVKFAPLKTSTQRLKYFSNLGLDNNFSGFYLSELHAYTLKSVDSF